MFTLPGFNLSDILTFYKVIRIKTQNGALLPFICETNEETRAWQAPRHPTDTNSKITDTLWTDPKKMSFTGFVPAKRWEEFDQLIKGGDAGEEKELLNSIARNIFGGVDGGKAAGLGLYEITVLGGVYKDMALVGLTRSETAEVNSAYKVTLDFQEVLKVSASSSVLTAQQVKEAQDASTQELGQQTAKAKNSDLYNIRHGISG